MSRDNDDYVEIDCEYLKGRDTELAIFVRLPSDRITAIPKSQSYVDEDGAVFVREWLATKNGLI